MGRRAPFVALFVSPGVRAGVAPPRRRLGLFIIGLLGGGFGGLCPAVVVVVFGDVAIVAVFFFSARLAGQPDAGNRLSSFFAGERISASLNSFPLWEGRGGPELASGAASQVVLTARAVGKSDTGRLLGPRPLVVGDVVVALLVLIALPGTSRC